MRETPMNDILRTHHPSRGGYGPVFITKVALAIVNIKCAREVQCMEKFTLQEKTREICPRGPGRNTVILSRPLRYTPTLECALVLFHLFQLRKEHRHASSSNWSFDMAAKDAISSNRESDVKKPSEVPANVHQVLSEFKRNKTLTIVVTGRTGVGKSTLIGSLLGKAVQKVHLGPASAKHEIIEKYEGKVRDASVNVYDTHGFRSTDPSDSTYEKELLKELKI